MCSFYRYLFLCYLKHLFRCTGEDSAIETVPDSQTDSQDRPPSTKRRKLVEEEKSSFAETPLISESVDVNKSLNGSRGNLKPELADSIVEDHDSLEIKHHAVSECNVEHKGKETKHEATNKIEMVADSLDVSGDHDMAVDETHGYDEKEEKKDEHANPKGIEAEAEHMNKRTEQTVKEHMNGRLSHKTTNEQHDKAKHLTELHVPAGFLCSRIPRKVWK